MNQDEMVAFFERYQVPYMDTGAGLAMQGWGNLPRHLQEKMKHEQRTGGKNRAQRRASKSHIQRTRWHHEQSPEQTVHA